MSRAKAERPWLRAVRSTEEASNPKSAPPEGSNSASDAELIEAVLKGDAKIAGLFHDRLIRVIDHTLYRVLGRRAHDHDDLIQTSFEQVLRTLTKGSFAGRCSLRTWAARITTHVALNALRSRQRERKVIQNNDDLNDDFPLHGREGNAEARVELDHVRNILATMKASRSEVFVLHDVHGHSLDEIAVMMNLSVSAAQSRLVRGRSELHEKLNRTMRSVSWKSKLPWKQEAAEKCPKHTPEIVPQSRASAPAQHKTEGEDS